LRNNARWLPNAVGSAIKPEWR
jgi:hypothetical protein